MADKSFADLLREAGVQPSGAIQYAQSLNRPVPYRSYTPPRPLPRRMRPADVRAYDDNTGVAQQAMGEMRRDRMTGQDAMLREAQGPASNQFADAGMVALETTGVPALRRSYDAFEAGDPRQGIYEGIWGGLGLAGTLGAIPGARRAPRAPMREPVLPQMREAPTPPPGNVLPVRPPQPFRQSLIGGADDLTGASRGVFSEGPQDGLPPRAPDAGAGRGDNLPRYPTKAERDRAERAHLESLIERAQRLTAETRETANALEEMRNSAAESRNRIRAAAERAEQIRATAPAEPVDTTPLVFPQDLDELRVFTERLRNEGPDVLRAEQRAAREALNPPDGGARVATDAPTAGPSRPPPEAANVDGTSAGSQHRQPRTRASYEEAIEKARQDYDYVGLRTDDGPLSPELRSRVWDDGEPTGEMLDGLSVTDVNAPEVWSMHNFEPPRRGGHYFGENTHVIAGNRAYAGRDRGELVITDPVIILDPARARAAPTREPVLPQMREPPAPPPGSVLPVRPPQPFRQSLIGGADDLTGASRGVFSDGPPDGMPTHAPDAGAGRTEQGPDGGARGGGIVARWSRTEDGGWSYNAPINSKGDSVELRIGERRDGVREISWDFDGTSIKGALPMDEIGLRRQIEQEALAHWDQIGRPQGTTPWQMFAETDRGRALSAEASRLQSARLDADVKDGQRWTRQVSVPAFRAVERGLREFLDQAPVGERYVFMPANEGLAKIYALFAENFHHPRFVMRRTDGGFELNPRFGDSLFNGRRQGPPTQAPTAGPSRPPPDTAKSYRPGPPKGGFFFSRRR